MNHLGVVIRDQFEKKMFKNKQRVKNLVVTS